MVLMVSAVAVLEVRYPAPASGRLFGIPSHVLNNEPRKKKLLEEWNNYFKSQKEENQFSTLKEI